ncbi:hypothetical protein V8G54_024348 [Vigna mungo]|uniref:Uncharacterized protein n=1 Tax=Vigna mungo TaxID=3915 RepID=A0AAQ3RR82_VIGMU
MLCSDWAKMISRNGHKYFSTGRIGTAIPLSTFCGKGLIGSVLIVPKMVDSPISSTTIRVRIGPGHANCKHQCRIDPGLACHLCRNKLTALDTVRLSLSKPFLKTLQTETVPTRSRDGPLR